MVGASSVLKLFATTLFLVILAFVTAVGYSLIDPIYANTVDASLMTKLGWGAPQGTVITFMGISLAGLGLVVVLWWIFSPIREDTRQSQRPPP